MKKFSVKMSRRLVDDGNKMIDYVSWCRGSETIFLWKWEITIHNRRK